MRFNQLLTRSAGRITTHEDPSNCPTPHKTSLTWYENFKRVSHDDRAAETQIDPGKLRRRKQWLALLLLSCSSIMSARKNSP